jgi:2'-5' RNA ligase
MQPLHRQPNRRQASLYLSGFPEIEALRREFNPVQAQLIPAHVTLCREDEVDDWEAIAKRIVALRPVSVTLRFGGPVRDGNLVLLPTVGLTESFDQLRFDLLSKQGAAPRKHLPHITMIHPRNGVCTDAIFEEIAARILPFTATFREISLIEQRDGGVWKPFC